MKDKKIMTRNTIKTKPGWILKGIWTTLLLVFMASVWPGYMIYVEKVLGKSDLSRAVVYLDAPAGTRISQYFCPQGTRLEGIKFAICFDEIETEGKQIVFTLSKENGDVIMSRDILLNQIDSSMYYEVKIGQKVNRGERYCWTIALPSDFSCEMLCTGIMETKTPENKMFAIGEQSYEEVQAAAEYSYRLHPDKAEIVGKYWISAILIYILGMEMIARFQAASVSRKKNGIVTKTMP